MDFNSLNATASDITDAAQPNSTTGSTTSANGDRTTRLTSAAGSAATKTPPNMRTPTDFSEAETSSSGFADETSNKHTQTDEALVCTIADGEDKFSIYDDACTIDGHFGTRPQYRDLFKEIFAILKKAAVNKDEGEKLPLLDQEDEQDEGDEETIAADLANGTEGNGGGESAGASVIDDTESIVSSVVSEQSVAMSERITKQERKTIMETVKKHCEKSAAEKRKPLLLPPSTDAAPVVDKEGRVLTPLKRDHLEYISISVNVRKKNRKKSRGSACGIDRSDSPVLPSPPRVFFTSSGKKRRDMRSTTMASAAAAVEAAAAKKSPAPKSPLVKWDGTSMTVYNRGYVTQNGSSPLSPLAANATSPYSPVSSTAQGSVNGSGVASGSGGCLPRRPEFKRQSTASQNLQKLMKLDLSYAEVLRRGDPKRIESTLEKHAKAGTRMAPRSAWDS